MPNEDKSRAVTVAKATTTTATQATLMSHASSTANRVHQVFVKIMAWRTDVAPGTFECYYLMGLFRNDAGTLGQSANSPQALGNLPTSQSGAVTMDVNSNDIRVRITGVASQTWRWEGWMEVNTRDNLA